MKKIYNLILLITVFLLVTACGEDLEVTVFNSPPQLILNNNDDFNAGEDVTLTASALEGEVSDLASGSMSLLQGMEVLFSTTTNLSGKEATISLPVNVSEPGAYRLAASVTDTEGAVTADTIDINVSCAPLSSCVEAGSVTFVVVVPDFTPDDASIGIVGSLTNWGGDPDITLTNISGTNCYCAAVPVEDLDGAEYKLRLNSTWDMVEKNADCSEASNRIPTGAAGETVTITVAEWRNSNTFNGSCPN